MFRVRAEILLADVTKNTGKHEGVEESDSYHGTHLHWVSESAQQESFVEKPELPKSANSSLLGHDRESFGLD